MGTIICYGDSNTYGYDPQEIFGGRYAEDRRWPEILHAETDWTVKNCGLNGRCVPYFLPEIQHIQNALSVWAKEDAPVWLWVMLGTNDLLHNAQMNAESVTERMERFLKTLEECDEIADGQIRLRLISPAHLQRGMWVETDALCRESEKLDVLYRELADRLGIEFTCAGKWEIPLLYDGVHFSEEGNRKFADCIRRDCMG